MRILLDSCVSGGARMVLEDGGQDVVWSGNWDHDPGDQEILAWAYGEGRILVTLDKDFGEWALLRRIPHCGVIRLVGFTGRQQGTVCAKVLNSYAAELELGAIVTAEPGRVRSDPPTLTELNSRHPTWL